MTENSISYDPQNIPDGLIIISTPNGGILMLVREDQKDNNPGVFAAVLATHIDPIKELMRRYYEIYNEDGTLKAAQS